MKGLKVLINQLADYNICFTNKQYVRKVFNDSKGDFVRINNKKIYLSKLQKLDNFEYNWHPYNF